MIGAVSIGRTSVSGLLEAEDVLCTAVALRALGAGVEKMGQDWIVDGVGVGGLTSPDDILDLGNSGTAARLLLGLMATHDLTAHITGDHSLRSRPMNRVIDPLSRMGAFFHARDGGRMPLVVHGATEPIPLEYEVPVPSAQVKSAVLLAGLNTPGRTVVVEAEATRDHTERMLAGFGAEITTEETDEGRVITLTGQPELVAQEIDVPRDPSSAAFPVCAALITEGSDVLVPNIGLNPTRAGLYETLRDMGADLVYENLREVGGEPVADLRARYSPDMKGIEVPAARAASMIDEYPVLSVVACFAEGKTYMPGVKELRVKESDRIDAMAVGLRANGATVDETEDSFTVHGMGPKGLPGGGTAAARLDHRIAMSFMVAGMGAQAPVHVDDAGPITTSFPIFEPLMDRLGARLERT